MGKVTNGKIKVRGELKWVVSTFVQGRRKRIYSSSAGLAETHASKLRGDAIGARQLLVAIPQAKRKNILLNSFGSSGE